MAEATTAWEHHSYAADAADGSVLAAVLADNSLADIITVDRTTGDSVLAAIGAAGAVLLKSFAGAVIATFAAAAITFAQPLEVQGLLEAEDLAVSANALVVGTLEVGGAITATSGVVVAEDQGIKGWNVGSSAQINMLRMVDNTVTLGDTGRTLDIQSAITVTAGTGVATFLGTDTVFGRSSTSGHVLRRSQNDSSLSIWGGNAVDVGAGIIMTGSAHGSLASTALAMVGSTEVFRWNATSVTFAQNMALANDKYLLWGAGGTGITGNATSNRIQFYDTSVVRATLASGVLIMGAGGLPGSALAGGIRAVGLCDFDAGFTLGADTDVLDKYRFTTFTPTLTINAGTTGITYSTRVGRYVKIGRLVFIHINIVLSSKGSEVGNLGISGLPFTNNNSAEGIPAMSVSGLASAANEIFLVMFGATSGSLFYKSAGTGVNSNLSDGQITNTFAVSFTGCYEATT